MRDPWYSAGPPGTWSRGDFKQGEKPVLFASSPWWNSEPGDLRQNNESGDGGLYDRANAALNWGSDNRFARLIQKFMSCMR